MTENYSFRSAVNGFNRKDVLDFAEKLLREKDNDKKRIEECENLLKEKEQEIEKLRKELCDEKEKCKTCETVKKYEARLGAALLDAKRFSESMIQEANDNVADMFSEVSGTTEAAISKTQEISDEMSAVAEKFSGTFNLLLSDTQKLIEKMNSFRKEINVNNGEEKKQQSKDSAYSKMIAAAFEEAFKGD